MNVVVAHHLWGRVGGGELLNAYVVKALLESGHKVAIASTFGFNKEDYKRWFGVDLGQVRTYTLLPKMLPFLGIYQRLGLYVPLQRAVKKLKADVVFIDCELYKPITKLKRKISFKILEYIHFPFHALRLEKGEVPREYEIAFKRYLSDVTKYHIKYERGMWKYYFKLWLRLYEAIARDNPFEVADVVMANSSYIGKLVKMLWGDVPIILHPPVKVEDFHPHGTTLFQERDNSIVMIGRISPEKRIEDVIDAIALSETNPKLKVVGGLIPANISYMRILERRAKEKNVKLKFYVNAPRKELVKIATSSKVFVHSTIGEHFGIAVVEGMAAGCPVIVHKSGGPYEDIIERGEYGLYYTSIKELAEKIDQLVTSEKLWKSYHEKSLMRASIFGERSFKRKFLEIVERVG
jgi:glycosyltransferase involved in cell wall biosynthesis